MPGRVRVYIATSLDGFIAGPDDDLSWLPPPDADDTGDADFLAFEAFMPQVGALLMGRRTYAVVEGMDTWYYGETPVLVATRRELTPKVPTVRAVSGTLGDMIAEAKRTAGDKDVYIDGGDLIRQALAAGHIDELVVTVVPVILGRGFPLFAGMEQYHPLTWVRTAQGPAGMVQLTYRPTR